MSKTKRAIPVFSRPIIETHCHLDYLTEHDLATTLEQARAIGVERFMTISVSPENIHQAFAIASAHDDVYCALGVHPHDAQEYQADSHAFIEQHAQHPKVVAIGEIGLDYYYDHCDRDVQKQVFERQLNLACEQQKPIVIHTREADNDTQALLEQYAPKLGERKGVIHSFTSGMDLALACLEMGFCIGINGIVTFNKADNVREIAKAVPLDRLLLETDAPYLTPAPYRGRENAPKYLPFVAETIADVKGVRVETVLDHAYDNALRTFFPSHAQTPATDAPR